FYLIFSVELWERFGFYGLQALLAVYLVQALTLSETHSFALFSYFIALVYGLVAVGGWLGDKVLGTKRLLILGALTLMFAYAMLAFSGNHLMWVYLVLGTIAVGTGLFKANPSSLLSKCYAQHDPRLAGAFVLYYLSTNLVRFVSIP
ncbi:dipeptide/tripeptide permease, partial [Plesiomonas shigelloides]